MTNKTQDSSKTERLALRLTPEFKAKLQAAAEAENRSMSNYIIYVLKKAIDGGSN